MSCGKEFTKASAEALEKMLTTEQLEEAREAAQMVREQNDE